MYRDGVDVLADVFLGALCEAVGAEALRFTAVFGATAENRWVVVAPAGASGTAGAGEGLGTAWTGFVHHVFLSVS